MMYMFMEDYVILFVIALITICITIILRSAWMTLVQAVLFNLPAVLPNNMVTIVAMFVVQFAFGLLVMYKFFKATELNYDLVLEKTHQKDRELTKHGHGTRFSFWNTDE